MKGITINELYTLENPIITQYTDKQKHRISLLARLLGFRLVHPATKLPPSQS